jgi:hypothetical protein
MEGMLSETGSEDAITGDCADEAMADDSAGLAVEVVEEATDDGAAEAEFCAGALFAHPVRSKRTTAAEAR